MARFYCHALNVLFCLPGARRNTSRMRIEVLRHLPISELIVRHFILEYSRHQRRTIGAKNCGRICLLIIKITISSIVIGLKKLLFSTNLFAKLLSDSLLLDNIICQYFNAPISLFS